VSKAGKTPDLLHQTANRLQIGCLGLLINLFLAGFCLWGVFAAYQGWQLETRGLTTNGTVVLLEESSDPDGGCCVYSPVVEFEANGQVYTFESGNASDPPQYKVSQTVPVRYDPTNPGAAQIDSFFERWLFPVIIIPTMLVTALILNILLLRAWWRGTSLEE